MELLRKHRKTVESEAMEGGLLSDALTGNGEPIANAERCREYYMGEGGGFPRVRAVVSLVCQSARGLSQHPRVFPNVN
jgi:hypothetical protein